MADDYTNNTATRGLLTPGGQVSGKLETARDSDWFKISVSAGSYYTFELSSTAANSYSQSLSFYNAEGGYLGSTSGSNGGMFKYAFKAPSTGPIYVAVGDMGYSGFAPLSYTLKASKAVADDIGDTRGTARTLALGQSSSAVLEGGSDIDYFKVSVQAGITYTVTPSWNAGGTSSSASGHIRVEDGNGTYVVTSGLSGGQSFTATATGDYYFAVTNSYGPVSGYSITVAKAVDDHAANKAGAGRLTVGEPASTGTINVAGDLDWYGVQLDAGQTYWFKLGAGGSPGYSGYGTLKLIAEDGTVVATSSGNYVNSASSLLLEYVPTAAGKYYLQVSGDSYSTGNYAVRAVVGETDDHGNTQASATALEAGQAADGKLAIPQDVDMFKLAVTAGKTYVVALTGRELDKGAELTLNGQAAGYAGNGTLAEYAKARIAEYRVLTADTTGDYYFTVAGGYSGGTGTYTLLASEAAADDYAADKSTTAVLAVDGGISGTLDYTGDVDTFKITLQYGAKYAFQLRGAGSGEGTLPLGSGVQLQIAGPEQSGYANLVDNRDGTYTITTTTGGDYYLSVRPQMSYYASTNPDPTGSYTLRAVALNGDTAAPTLVSHAPATNAGPQDNITLRFSEAIMRGSHSSSESITLRDSLGVTLETYYSGDSRISISGDTLTIDPTVNLKPGTKYFLSVPGSSVVDLAGNKLASSELLSIDTVGTVAAGTAGNDYMVGLGIGITLSGGAGTDTVIYGYGRGNYDVVRGVGTTTVTSKAWDNTSGAADVLEGVERLMFADTTVALDVDGVAGQAYRLYRAAFDRVPDKTGVGFWISQMDDGASLLTVARAFLGSAEFTSLYGTAPDNGIFVTKLYQNVLHRAPDQGGVDYWMGVLGAGADRAEVLAAFSEAAENQAAVAQVIGNGFEYTPYG